MLDIKLVRENPGIIENNLKKRGMDTKMLKELIEADAQRRSLIQKTDALKKKRNELTKEISQLKEKKKPIEKKLDEVKKIPEEIKKLDRKLELLTEKTNYILMRLPNILHESVPIGKDDSENKEIRKWGEPKVFDFKPKGHVEILQSLGLIEADKAADVTGHGFFYLKGELALLDYALQRYAIDFMMKKDYLLVEPPFMLKRKPYEGVTDIADFENVMYKIEGEDLYMIATSEHPMMALFMDEAIEKVRLPIKLIGISPCFRKEVGAHGKYTRGLFRMHHFNKIEQAIICLPEQSWQLHEELQRNSEEIYQSLGLHYRVVNICTGDIGTIAAKKYDIEAWMADGQYREVGSCSNCTDYQARRLNIKYKEKKDAPVMGFAHTLNNTAIATSRAMVAIIEQFQQKDGTIKIPSVLQPYMNGKEFVGK
ncbi:MAG TPA: serine--tRNA ligase [archaeon]|nr:serine--tRNA ligase [archaeon]